MDVTNNNSVAIEAFNAVSTNLGFLGVDKELKKIVVTSSVKGEGKTTVSTNMAHALANMNKRVLLVDGDLRNPTVHRVFSLPNRKGLSDVILSHNVQEEFSDAVVEYSPLLHILTAGHRPPNPTELLGSKRMNSFLQEAGADYDYVLLDSPPILMIPDALALTDKTDGLILVVRHGYTTKDMLKNTKEALEVVNTQPLACILNSMPVSQNAYTRYGYYADDTKKTGGGRAKKRATRAEESV